MAGPSRSRFPACALSEYHDLPMKLLYICSSQFSGTTLTSFLLNSHSAIATIGHTTGWQYAGDEDFRCSCGSRIRDCRLFSQIRATFEEHGLPFDPQNFGTDFQLADNARVNQVLTGPVPGLRSSSVEHVRDALVRGVPRYRRRLATQERANLLLMQTVLDFYNAFVYLDNSHSPYRFRRLSQSATVLRFSDTSHSRSARRVPVVDDQFRVLASRRRSRAGLGTRSTSTG